MAADSTADGGHEWTAEQAEAFQSLGAAVRRGNLERVKDLIASGAPLVHPGAVVPLDVCIEDGWLLSYRVKDSEKTPRPHDGRVPVPLYSAIRLGHFEAARALVEAGADVNAYALSDFDGTALSALMKRNTERRHFRDEAQECRMRRMFHYLLEKGARVDVTYCDHWVMFDVSSVLLTAGVISGHFEPPPRGIHRHMYEWLKNGGASVLISCMAADDRHTFAYLLERFDFSAKILNGALAYAGITGCLLYVHALIMCGASLFSVPWYIRDAISDIKNRCGRGVSLGDECFRVVHLLRRTKSLQGHCFSLIYHGRKYMLEDLPPMIQKFYRRWVKANKMLLEAERIFEYRRRLSIGGSLLVRSANIYSFDNLRY